MLLIETYLAPSEIDGIGLFTRGPIEKGALIWEFMPQFDRLIARKDYDALSGPLHKYLEMYCYPKVGDDRYLVFEVDDARFMNHSNSPNCDFGPGDKAYSLSFIRAGGELTCDYRTFLGDALEMLPSRNGQRGATSS